MKEWLIGYFTDAEVNKVIHEDIKIAPRMRLEIPQEVNTIFG